VNVLRFFFFFWIGFVVATGPSPPSGSCDDMKRHFDPRKTIRLFPRLRRDIDDDIVKKEQAQATTNIKVESLIAKLIVEAILTNSESVNVV